MDSSAAAADAKVRLVKCPRCQKILAEYADFPLYRCGGCSIILQAKYHKDARENSASGLPEINHSPVLSTRKSSGNHRLISSQKKMFLSSWNRKGEQSFSEKHDCLDNGNNDEKYRAEGKTNERFDTNSAGSSSKGMQIVSSLGSEYGDRVSDKYLSLSRRTFKHHRVTDPENVLATNEMASDAEEQLKPVSRRSYRQQRQVLDSTNEEEDGVLDILATSVTTYAEEQLEVSSSQGNCGQHIVLEVDDGEEKEGDGINGSAIDLGFDSTGDEQSSEFYSVKNWLESKKNFFSKSKSKQSTFHNGSKTSFMSLQQEPLELLRKFNQPKQDNVQLIRGSCSCSQSASSHSSETPMKEKKTFPAKRHCRPVSGGAPFVICSNCFQLLQLPVDFLVFSRKLHKLQCGACSQVLVFSFRSQARARLSAPTQSEMVSFTKECKPCSTEAGLPLHRLMGYFSARELLNNPVCLQTNESIESKLPIKRLSTRSFSQIRTLNHDLEKLKIMVNSSRTAPAP